MTGLECQIQRCIEERERHYEAWFLWPRDKAGAAYHIEWVNYLNSRIKMLRAERAK